MITAISNERQGCAISGATSPPGVSARTASLRAGSEGYNDIDRLPGPRQLPCAYSNTCIRDIGTRVKAAWPMTADEQRPFAYFQQHPIVSLTALFELPLWQRHALQMCHADQAIFHAVTMLSAAHQSSELKHMQRVQGTSVHRAYCFSLQQSSRAMRLLSQRLASQDPELRHVVLLCSLLFGLSDVLLDRHESAWTHFLSGLRILKEIEHHPYLISKAEPSLVAVYRRISLQAALYSTKISWADVPPSPVPTYVPPPPPDDALKASATGHQDPVDRNGPGPLWLRLRRHYNSLYIAQSRLLCTFAQFVQKFIFFCESHSPTLPKNQQSTLDLLHLLILGHILSLKIAGGPLPLSVLPEV
ncbi:hypothetical protein AN3353.2 [Aspergillus nidulans FGSC A4]|uniref:Transcription factor domain-containing protein n=1 Tax=Emericella nidulans (strain FGSC A4 / ATCC 38163 / CBS 112.46 / NRRL 194 / M139) TaxID=227321 RepID=Q5B7X7_EMENI|nr:hypothetical protein [Aspergillus nidulans FGSC A4]EAA63321.1 hypothetical protein AN3353.2 [Aspergillus nidulans FGSC A4]CBF82885.1 TPA: conserved hypothetical protein [Aspergillus nidulans FGSC A4]|eukprot:XP_660957.1 hypothetical protein AN3353.2 [Aspergillus nidulans FGSC A4]